MNGWSDWTERETATLRQLWAEGHSTSEIARRINRTKNMVVGKVHRLKLPARPNPINRSAGTPKRAPAPQRAAARTLPPMASLVLVAPAPPPPRLVADEPTPPGLEASPPGHACCWPLWGDERPTHLYCGAALHQGTYCQAHAARAYLRHQPDERPAGYNWIYGSAVRAVPIARPGA